MEFKFVLGLLASTGLAEVICNFDFDLRILAAAHSLDSLIPVVAWPETAFIISATLVLS